MTTPSDTPLPVKRLILCPQDKGGIGKSFIATLLYDFLIDRAVKVKTFDLDHANSTFQRYVPEAEFIDTDVDADKLAVLDQLVSALETVDTVLVDKERGYVLSLGGVRWNEADFCRGWEIDGRTGSGKTASGVVPILHALKRNRPGMGILALDTKGDLSEPIEAVADDLGCRDDLRQLEVRPDKAPPGWRPPYTFNFLGDTSLPASTYAKLLVDVATAAGQKGGQTFFKNAAQVAIQNGMNLLAVLDVPVTIENCYRLVMDLAELEARIGELEKVPGPLRDPLLDYFREFKAQPKEQLGGVRYTVFNYLQPYTVPDIAEVFCPTEPTFDLAEIDLGRLVSVKIPQKYQTEKRYVSLMLKALYYLHALRRYDLSGAERARKNLIVGVFDEAQESVLLSEDGISDYNVIDKIRGARATAIFSTQSPTSYIPPMGGRDKADVFRLNLGNKIHFTAADKDASEMIAESIGKRTIKKRTWSSGSGKRSISWTDDDQYFIKPHVLRRLPKHVAVIKHCEQAYRWVRLPPSPFTKPKAIDASRN